MIGQRVFNVHPPHFYQKTTPEYQQDKTLYDLINTMSDPQSFVFDITKTPSYQSVEKLEEDQKQGEETANQRQTKWRAKKAECDLKLTALQDALEEIKQEIHSFPSSHHPLTPSLNQREEEKRVDATVHSREETDIQEATRVRFDRINTVQYETFGLMEQKERLTQEHKATSLACRSLQEQWNVLLEQQRGYQKQIQLYQDQVLQKKAQQRETLEKEQTVKNEINTFLDAKRETLDQLLHNIDVMRNNQLSQMKSQFDNQLDRIAQAIDQDLTNLSTINQEALSTIQRLWDHHLQEIRTTQHHHLNQIANRLDSARSYVNTKRFTIRNVKVDEYAYAATYSPKNIPNRRYVFCWKGGQRITQGYWAIISHSNGTFSFKNTTHDEYLFASNYQPFSDAYPARTWKPKELVQEAYWQLEPLGNHQFRVFNTYYRNYLCVSFFKRTSDDDERRTVVVAEEADIWEIQSAGNL